jgi:hypothetical protein
MHNTIEIESALSDPQSLEEIYQRAKNEGAASDFAAEIARRHSSTPGDVLLAAWYYRLLPEHTPGTLTAEFTHSGDTVSKVESGRRDINWKLAIALSATCSVGYWLLTGDISKLSTQFPDILLTWGPAAACGIIAFIALAARTPREQSSPPCARFLASPLGALLTVLGIIALTIYALWMGPTSHLSYRTLMVLHLPLLAWAAILLYVVGPGQGDRNRFAALVKSADIVMTGGIFFGAAAAFVLVTFGLFGAIGVNFPEPIQRWLIVGVPGLIPVLAVALVYDPKLPPAEQRFDQGLPKLILSIARIMLPFALIVGAIYMLLIPANFYRPFEQRQVLIVYNAMLFGVMALLLFATPLELEDIPEKWQTPLRRAILALAIMAVIVSLYALSATSYRTTIGGLTINRLTVIGWNVLNIMLLCLYLYRQFRLGREMWISSTRFVFRIGIFAYALWAGFLVLAIPLLFPTG